VREDVFLDTTGIDLDAIRAVQIRYPPVATNESQFGMLTRDLWIWQHDIIV
jgi:hypothetical protein